MHALRIIGIGAIVGLALYGIDHLVLAQTSVLQPGYAVVLTTCGTGPSYTNGTIAPITINVAGETCVNK